MDVIMSLKDYCQIAINIFQGYASKQLESKFLQTAIKTDFRDLTEKHQDLLGNKTLNKILSYCISRDIWIEGSNHQFELLVKFVLASIYEIYLGDWEMNSFNNITQVFGKISWVVVLRLQHLRDKKPEEIQQLQNI